MSRTLRISLVVPNFNSGATLERALRSIIDQQDPNLQLIVADAGSTDSSRAIIDRHRDHIDAINDRDDGQADGLNRGFRLADGDVFGWLCADDELFPGSLSHVREIFEQDDDVAVVNGACERVFPDGLAWTNPGHDDPWRAIAIQNVIEQPSTFWRAALHRRLGELDTSYDIAFDWDFWCRMAASGARMQRTDRALSRYHFSDENKSGAMGNRFADEAYRIIERHGPKNGRVARIFKKLYWTYDVHGCLDRPPSGPWGRRAACRLYQAFLSLTGNWRWLRLYNWHFASLQQRGLRWW